MASTAPPLIRQLRAILTLTQTEAQIARIRVAQARTDAVRRELTENGDNAEERSHLVAERLLALGGVPDVVTPLIGRLNTFFKSTMEQAQPFDEALLGDLALEQQLLSRARYLKTLAQAADDTSTRKLAERLETAHSTTVEWLTTVLAEEALGGPAALRATPLQRVAGAATMVVNIPGRFAWDRFNRTVHAVQRAGGEARSTAEQVGDRAARIGDAARDVLSTGRDASLQRAETIARGEKANNTADAVHATRGRLGILTEAELPISGYDELNTQDAVRQTKELTDTADVNAILNYEEAHKNRSGVVSAAQLRMAAIAKDAAGLN